MGCTPWLDRQGPAVSAACEAQQNMSSLERYTMTWGVSDTFVPWCVQVQALGTQKEQLQKRVVEVERERGLFFRHMEEMRRHSTTLQEDNGRLLTELNRLRQAMKQVGSSSRSW